MGERIKGITVEIGGDTTGLDKALSGVNKTLKDTQSQLKDVERLLKLDPSNTELLAQKQTLLKESISATKEKLDALKEAQEQAKQQLANGDIGQDKYNALQREIIATEQELEKLEKQAGDANTAMVKLGETGKSIEQLGGKITGVGTALTKNVTAPIAAIGAASIAAFNEVDGAMDTVIKKTGATGDEMEKLQNVVTNLATSIPTDFQTAGDAVGEVATRFDDVGDGLEDLSGKFIKFAELNNIDVTSAVDNVQASMAAFGVETKDAGLILDTLNAVGQQTGTDINTLTGLMTSNAGVMKEMGFSYEEAAFFMGTLNKNGVDTSSTMTGLKKAWQTASTEGKSMKDVLSEMNDTIKNATTDQEAYQAAIDVFGAKAGPAIAQAVRDGRLSLDEFNVSLSDFGGNLESTFDATLDPIDNTTLMMNELKATGAELASTVQEMLMPVMETLREKLHQLREWWSNLSKEQQQSIIKFAGIAAAIGPVLVSVGNVTSAVGKGMQAFSQFGKSLSTVKTAMEAGKGPLAALKTGFGGLSAPVLAVVAAIAVLVAAFVNLWKNNEEFRNKVTGIWNEIKAKFEEFGKGITERLNALGISFDDITATIKKVWDGFCELLAPVFESTFKQISTVLETVLDVLTGLLDIFIGVFTGNWDQAWNGVKEVFSGIWNGIKGTLENNFDTMKGVVNVFLGWFGTDWDTAWTNAKSAFENIWNSIKDAVSNVVDSIKDTFSNGFENAKDTVTNIFENIRDKISNILDSAKDTVRNAIDTIKSFFNFEWSLPHIKLPHFSISGSFSLNPPSIPTFSVDWYAKAMKDGMILNSPTIFGMQGNHLLAGGEAGSETVIGTKSLLSMIQDAVTASNQNNVTYGDLNIYVNSYGTDASQIADEIGAELLRNLRIQGSW